MRRPRANGRTGLAMLLAPSHPVAKTGLSGESRHAVRAAAALREHQVGRPGSAHPRGEHAGRVGGPRALGSWQGRAAGVTVLQLGRPDPRSAGERPPRSPGSALHPGGLCWAQAVPGGCLAAGAARGSLGGAGAGACPVALRCGGVRGEGCGRAGWPS